MAARARGLVDGEDRLIERIAAYNAKSSHPAALAISMTAMEDSITDTSSTKIARRFPSGDHTGVE